MSLNPFKHITAIHANVPGWIISLWLTIHGGVNAALGH